MLARIPLGALFAAFAALLASPAAIASDNYLHPDFQIAGMPKSGTSQMYQLLAKHKQVKALRKEWCPSLADIQQNVEYSREVTKEIEKLQALGRPGTKTVSACINPRLASGYFEFAQANTARPFPNVPKFIYLMRDPADLLWATFNFWTTASDIQQNIPGRWTSPENFRTPEFFHVLLEAEGRIQGSYNLTYDYLRDRYMLDWLDRIIQAAGRNNTIVIKSSDLEAPNVGRYIHKFAELTGLDVNGFDRKVLQGRTNSGITLNTRGATNFVRSQNYTGVYEISGFKPMLPKTRALIYERARSFCLEVKAKYGVHFEECLNQDQSTVAGPLQGTRQAPSWRLGLRFFPETAPIVTARVAAGPLFNRWVFVVACCWLGITLFAASAVLKSRSQKQRSAYPIVTSGRDRPLLGRTLTS